MTLSPGQTTQVLFRAWANSQDGAASGTYDVPAIVRANNSDTVQFNFRIHVSDLRRPQPSLGGSIDLNQILPCPRPTSQTQVDFSITVSNSGDYPLTVNSVGFDFPFPVEPLQGFGFFNVPARPPGGSQGSVNRNYRFSVDASAEETTYNGNVNVNTDFGGSSAPLRLTIVHPVKVTLPPATTAYDFGDVELTRTSTNPWRVVLREECRYKSATVSVDSTPPLPSFAIVSPTSVEIPRGQSRSLEVNVRFNSSHYNLLLRPQSFTLRLTSTAGMPVNYMFNATPVFIDIRDTKETLQSLGGTSPLASGREAATRMHGLLVNRTEVRRPQTQTELDDAARIVTLAEPVALTIERLGLIEAWNATGADERTVRDLVALTAGFGALEDLCEQVVDARDRPECVAVLAALRSELGRFAEAARVRYEGLAEGSVTSLDRARANAGLSLALSAIGEAQESARLGALATAHFANFTQDITAAQELLDAIEARREQSTPGSFLLAGPLHVTWHPLGPVLLGAYEERTESDYAAALGWLNLAGDSVRRDRVESEAAEFSQAMQDSRWVNRAIMASYGLLLLGAIFHAARATLLWQKTERMRRFGEFVLPESWPESIISPTPSAPPTPGP